MSDRGDNNRGTNDFTPEQVEAVLETIGVEVAGETHNDLLCYCPFHGNRFSPSFSVGRHNGKYICFNAACNESGSLLELVQKIGGLKPFPAKRLILKEGREGKTSITARLKAKFEERPDFTEFSPEVIARMKGDFWENDQALEYMRGRGFEDSVLDYFDVGYSAKKNLLAVPMHDPKGMPVGVVGRTLVGEKRFRNSDKLPTSKTLWNFHRAKKIGDSVILTEASFDAMRVHQAGFENVVACLGGNFSPSHFEQLDRTFNTIILMTDFDQKEKYVYENCRKCARRNLRFCVGHNPGRDLGALVAEGLNRKRVLWASYEHRLVYPDGAKDAGDMTDDQIRQCVKNAVSKLEYSRWGLY